ncbi:MAG: glycerol kinase GlpK [Deltaproteobacteria bacterium]|nr:glycerol kinase GlpK [Deltaproteobacteria bacterium]MBW1870564.1 glycerol kinase GlpK [Deltaproteobacteria bacterium]
MGKFILAIDQGTTGSTAALFDTSGNMQAKVNKEFRQIFPKPGWVEHDLDDIWKSVTDSIQAVLTSCAASGQDIVAIGITNQRETTAVWDFKTGQAVHNAIVWQCRRTADYCAKLKQAGHEPLFRQRTGLVLDPYFSGTKLRWLLDNVAGLNDPAQRGDVRFGTIDSYLVYRLTGRQAHITDVSNASRTLLMNLDDLAWDDQLLGILGIPKAMLPEIRSSSEKYGTTRQVPGLPDGIPICGIAGDQQAALFGQACFDCGQVKCTYGTGAFVLMNTGQRAVRSTRGLLTTVGWKIDNEVVYALEGSVFIAGAAVQWLRDGLGILNDSADIASLASQVESSDGVVFVPALVGLGAPRWNPEARGIISGITRGTTTAHLCRATLEGIAFQVRDVVETMRQDAEDELAFLRVDGGAAANDLLLQFQSDILGVEIHRPKILETTALGAALLAGLAAGVFNDRDEICNKWQRERLFKPEMDAKHVASHLSRWEAAVAKT